MTKYQCRHDRSYQICEQCVPMLVPNSNAGMKMSATSRSTRGLSGYPGRVWVKPYKALAIALVETMVWDRPTHCAKLNPTTTLSRGM